MTLSELVSVVEIAVVVFCNFDPAPDHETSGKRRGWVAGNKYTNQYFSISTYRKSYLLRH